MQKTLCVNRAYPFFTLVDVRGLHATTASIRQLFKIRNIMCVVSVNILRESVAMLVCLREF